MGSLWQVPKKWMTETRWQPLDLCRMVEERDFSSCHVWDDQIGLASGSGLDFLLDDSLVLVDSVSN